MIQFRFMWIFSSSLLLSFLLQLWMISTCIVVGTIVIADDKTSSSHLYYPHHHNIETTIIHDDDDKDRNFYHNDKERQPQSQQCHMINDHSMKSSSPMISDSISTSCDTISSVTSLSLSDAAVDDDEIILTTTQWNYTYNDPSTNNDMMMKIPPYIYRFIILLQYCETCIIPMILIPIYTISVILYISYRIYQKFYIENDKKRHSNTVVPSTIPNHTNETNDSLMRISPKQATTAIQIQNNDHNQTATNIIQQEDQQPQQPIDMSGSYQMTSHSNLDMFLSVQGVPWPLRRAASSVLPIHHIQHRHNQLLIKIEAKSSGFTTQTQYTIHGPPVETNVRGRIFSDTVYYYYENINTTTTTNDDTDTSKQQCVGIMTEKRAITEGYIVTVLRKFVNHNHNNDVNDTNDTMENINNDTNHPSSLSSNPTTTKSTNKTTIQQIHMTSTVSFPNEPEKDDVICIQLFDRIIA